MDVQSAIAVISGLVIVSVIVAYWMAATGELMDSRFGRAVFISTVLSIAFWVLLTKFAPEALAAIGISSFDLGLLFAGMVFLAGAAAALFDFIGWLRGEWTTPPPPFQQ